MNVSLRPSFRANLVAGLAAGTVSAIACASLAVAEPSLGEPIGHGGTGEPVDIGAAKHSIIDLPGTPAFAGFASSCPRTPDAVVGWLNAAGPNACKRQIRG